MMFARILSGDVALIRRCGRKSARAESVSPDLSVADMEFRDENGKTAALSCPVRYEFSED